MKTATIVLTVSLAACFVWGANLMAQVTYPAGLSAGYAAPYPARVYAAHPYPMPRFLARGVVPVSGSAYRLDQAVVPVQSVSAAANSTSILATPSAPTPAPPPPTIGPAVTGAVPMSPVAVDTADPEAAEPWVGPACGACAGSGCDACAGPWQGCCGAANCGAVNACGPLHGLLGRLLGCGLGSGLGCGLTDPALGRPSRLWLRADYLLWWNKNRTLPALATTSPDGTPRDQAGVLGQPGTSILFGGGEIDDEPESGARVDFGFWLDTYQTVGIGARMFQLGEEEFDFQASSTGSPILARPFFDVDQGQEDALLVAFPDVAQGSIDLEAFNRIRGVDVFLRRLLYAGYCNRVDLIGGYQFTEIDDRATLFDSLISTDPDGRVPVGTQIDTLDLFDAQNEFHGGSIGLMARAADGRLTWRLLSKIAFGNMHETVTIRGQTVTTIPDGPSATDNFGLLALPTNIGQYKQDQFVVVPEASVSVAYHLTNRLEASIGYSLVYWSRVVLAGDAIDRSINPTQIDGDLIGLARPSFTFRDQSFWAQGINFGLVWRY